MRRVFSVVFLLVVLAATVWTLMKWDRRSGVESDPWSALPLRSAIVIEIPDAWTAWDKFAHTSQLWASTEALPSAAAMGRLMARTMERAENDAALRAALQEVTMLVAVARTSNEQVDLLFSCAPRSSNGLPLHAFAEVLKADEATVAALQRGETVQVRPDTALPALSLSVAGGLWILATSPAMMDEAQLQMKSGTGLAQDSLLSVARGSCGVGSDAHVLVHLERAKSMLGRWWKPARIDGLDLPTGWAALDLRSRPDALLLSGLLFPDAPHHSMTALGHQGQGRNELARWMPAQVNAWSVQQVDDPQLYLHDLGRIGDPDTLSFTADLFHWVDGSIGLARVADTTAMAQWAYFRTDDVEHATAQLEDMCGAPCDTFSYRGTRATRLALPFAHERLLGEAYAAFEHPWWCALGDVIVFSPTEHELKTVVDAWNDGRTLAEDHRTAVWTDRMASKSGSTYRWDVARSAQAFAQGARSDQKPFFADLKPILERFGGLSIQLSPAQNDRVHIAIGLQHAPLEEKATGVHWSTQLPAGITRKVDILLNHTNGTREVLVQDSDHRIHVIGSTGKVLWSYKLDGPILGEVHQVDRFRNGKLQVLFNTKGRVYLIDRTGKDVGGFPVQLPGAATAPIAVFDYDGQRDYRILVPIADGRLLNYGMEGTLVTGWEAPRLASPVTNTPYHLRISNKDYILVVGGQGKVHLLDRRGAEREHTDLDLGVGARVRTVQPGLELMTTRVLWTDSAGTLMLGGLAKKPEVIALGNNAWSGLGLLGQDGRYDLVRIAMDTLAVSHGEQRLFSRAFGVALAPEAYLYQLEKGVATYGVVIPEREQVTLFDASGRELEGLPLKGSTPLSIADLDLDGTVELITVTREGLVVAYHAALSTPVR